MMLVKSRSTENLKRSQPIRIRECLTCPKSVESKLRTRDCDRLRSQPVRILQLIKQEEDKKSSVRKQRLPERLGQLSDKKHTSTKKQYNVQIYDNSKRTSNHVRRNLNFNNMPVGNGKNEKKSTDCSTKSTLPSCSQNCNEVSEPVTRKSLLLKPNSIKNKHLQSCTKETFKYSKLPEASKENIATCNRSKISIYSVKSKSKNSLLPSNDLYSKYNNNNSAESESKMKSKECKIVKNSNYSSLDVVNTNFVESCEISNTKPQVSESTNHQQISNNADQLCLQNNALQQDCSPEQSNIKCKKSETLKDKEKSIEDLCNNLQSTAVTQIESNLTVKHTSSEMIYVDKKEITRLKYELEDLVTTTEENLKKLKSTLTYVTKLLFVPDEAVSKSGTLKEKEENMKSMLDKEVQVETHCKLIEPTDLRIPDIYINENIHDVECKNTTVNDADVSFLNLENQLNIAPAKIQLSQENTPIVKKYMQKRSLKEYMTLKSSMTFLETPDGKKFKSLCQKNNIDKSTLNRTAISNKVLTELHNLYSDSPDSN